MKKTYKQFQWLAVVVLNIAIGLGMAGCSGGSSDEASITAAQQQALQARRAAQQAKPKDPLANMVKAVQPSKGDVPLEVRFEVVSRPEPGKATDIRLAFVPSADLQAIHATIKSVDGLQTKGDLQTNFAATKTGEIQEYTFTATAPNSGLFLVTVDVTVTRETGDNTFTYSIPVAVPNPAPVTASSAAGTSVGTG